MTVILKSIIEIDAFRAKKSGLDLSSKNPITK